MALPLVEISVDLASITFAPPGFDAGIGNVIIVDRVPRICSNAATMNSRLLLVALPAIAAQCISFARSDRSPEQIAAERALLSKKTALLERENQVLRDENLELTRLNDMARAEKVKLQAAQIAELERKSAQLKQAETTITNLNEKIGILESESGGRIKQLTSLNEQIAKKSADETRRLQEELTKTQLEAAQEKERLGKEAADKEFNFSKELQEMRARLAEKTKEADELRRQTNELRANETKLQNEMQKLRGSHSPATK